MIVIDELTYEDIGRWVEYHGFRDETERGRIKGWNYKFIFVVLRCDNNWDNFQEYTGIAVYPEDLTFVKEAVEEVKNESHSPHGPGG